MRFFLVNILFVHIKPVFNYPPLNLKKNAKLHRLFADLMLSSIITTLFPGLWRRAEF